MEKVTPFITIDDVTPLMYGVEFNSNINWTINKGEQWAVVGANGAGKTLLGDILRGRTASKERKIKYDFFDQKPDEYKLNHFPTEKIVKVSFESAYSIADYKSLCYQQRFNSSENDVTPFVGDLMRELSESDDDMKYWTEKLNLEPLYQKRVIMLSSGELRRFLIASILIKKPDLIIFDNPFIGLDKQTCASLNVFFNELAEFQQMIFLVPALNEIPDVVSHIMPVVNMSFGPTMTKDAFLSDQTIQDHVFGKRNYEQLELPESVMEPANYDTVMKITDINIAYPKRVLFKDLNWTIKKGEKWALLGQNGSGKSTLLSLLSADNPRAYAQNIVLFDKKRGTGESIWEIKKRIGYISSELHLYFRADQTCQRVVDSGFFDTIGLYKQCNSEQKKVAYDLMRMLGIADIAEKPYLKVSSGEQRLVLLARAIIKNPDLLILDEPLHGMDWQNKTNALKVIEKFCSQPDRTLIYVTHRREEIPACVDKFFELKYN